jgi:hypothetical protein
MKKINIYIFEKLKLNKDLPLSSNKYCDIYDVHEGDTVLCLCNSKKKSKSFIFWVKLFTAKVEKIEDDILILKSIKTGKIINEIKYKFEDHTKSSPHISNTFAFYKFGSDWSAIMHKDKALKMINNFLSLKGKTYIYMIGSFRFDPGDGYTKKQKLEELKKELEDN